MNEIAVMPSYEMPDTIEDLSKFVLIGREKLVAVRAEIRAIEKVGLAKSVRKQKLEEAQAISEAVLDAEVRIGQLMRELPQAKNNNPFGNNQHPRGQNDSGVALSSLRNEAEKAEIAKDVKESAKSVSVRKSVYAAGNKPKSEAIRDAGFTVRQVQRFQQLASHPEIVEQAKAEARENDDIVSRSLVLNMIKEQKRAVKEASREAARQENAEKVQAINNPLEAQGLFQTIVIDPAWDYSEEGDNDAFGRIKPSYHTMTIEEIEALPIAKIADANSHLYIWVTNRSIFKAHRLIEAWGFRYITCLTWIKPHFGVGNYFRSQTEHVLFGVKGSQPLKRHDMGTWFEAPCGKIHSEKPDKFYKLVESCSYGPYIDIFGRREREGWTVWGENA